MENLVLIQEVGAYCLEEPRDAVQPEPALRGEGLLEATYLGGPEPPDAS